MTTSLPMTGEDRLRALLGVVGDNEIRITFRDGEIFILRFVTEVIECEEDMDRRSTVGGMWSGEIVETRNVAPERERFHRPGSRVDFEACDVSEVSDELTARVLWSVS